MQSYSIIWIEAIFHNGHFIILEAGESTRPKLVTDSEVTFFLTISVYSNER